MPCAQHDLEACEACARATVEASHVQTPDAHSGDDAAAAPVFADGAFVGARYRVVRFLARGGMGEVYEAFDEELRVRVALKVAARTTGRATERFKREVNLARRVTHRNVCRLFEIGFEPAEGGELPYCTMELLAGTTLSQRIEAGRIELAAARSIAGQLVAGLQAAHDVGVIHRDFKSNNILLVRDDDDRERAVISDFGLARTEPGAADAPHTLTHDRALLGTPAYMSPEQVECNPATAASDIYSLGIVLFELATGSLPFSGDTPMATAIQRLKHAAPSARSRRSDLPASWDRAIARCLEVDPAKRFTRAVDVAAALDAEVPRHRARWALAGVALAALATVATVRLVARDASEGQAAALPPVAADGTRTLLVLDPSDPDPAHATAAGELLRAELRVPGKLRVIDGNVAARLARDVAGASLEARAGRLAGMSAAQLLVTGAVDGAVLTLQVTELDTGRVLRREREPAADLAVATAHLGERLRAWLAGADLALDADHAVKVLPADPSASHHYAEGLAQARALDHQHAIAALTQTTELVPSFGPAYVALYDEERAVRRADRAAVAAQHAFEHASGMRSDQRLRAEAIYRESRKEWPQAAALWSTLLDAEPDAVDVASALARTLASDHQVERCFDVLDRMHKRPPPVGDDPLLDLQEAMCAREAGDFRRALSAATRADVKAAARGERDTLARVLDVEGEMLANAGEYDRALLVLDRAKQVAEADGDREMQFEAMRQLAFVLTEQGKTADAIRVYRDALALAKQIGDRLAQGIISNDLGQTLENQQEALAMFQDGLAIAREADDERLITALSLNIANKQDDLGHSEDAIATYRDVIARATAQQDDENLATAQMNLGTSLVTLGRPAEALPLVDRALASFQRRDDEDGIGYALSARGDARWAAGDLAGARADFEAALAQRQHLGEARNASDDQDRLAHLDLAEDRAKDAEPLARAAVAQRRTGTEPGRTAGALITLAHTLAVLGRAREALDAIAESEQLAKPDPDQSLEVAFVRALAAPATAPEQLAILHARAAACRDCAPSALLHEAELERAAGHEARARELLRRVQHDAHALGAEDLVARAKRLLGN
ncbi:MAG TPA: protein kinase [Kofleriaceae bacterium]|jgi:tetratricopeptide (TPR) repeat protein